MGNSITSEVIAQAAKIPGAGIGYTLRRWRRALRVSQMDLAFDAGISSRHLSFIETGRSRPSREVVLQLAKALRLPLRQSNELLLAAGYAPEFSAVALDDERLAVVRHALRRHLRQHEPYPAAVVNSAYDILMTNEGFRRVTSLLAGPGALERHGNVYRLLFAADGLRPYVACWPAMRAGLLARLRGEALLTRDEAAVRLLAELEALPDPAAADLPADPWGGLPVMTLELCKDEVVWRFFSTVTSFGTPLDVTVQELRMECLFPADETTQTFFNVVH
jgi:transcriptional regulator with XRE-family HTH domain